MATTIPPPLTTISKVIDNIPITNRLFLSHINYKKKKNDNDDVDASAEDGNGKSNNNYEETQSEESEEVIKEGLKELFSEYGSVQEIFLSNKNNDNQKFDIDDDQRRYVPSFGFIAMENSQQAELAIRELSTTNTNTSKEDEEDNNTNNNDLSSVRKRKLRQLRSLFRNVQPARIYKSKQNPNNKKEKKRALLLQEYQKIKSYISIGTTKSSNSTESTDTNSTTVTANLICQTHTSHVERLQDYLLSKGDGVVQLIGCFSPQKCTSLILLRVTTGTCDLDLEVFTQNLWKTWYIAPNLNRITLLNDNDNQNKLIEGTIRKDVVPAIFRSLLLLSKDNENNENNENENNENVIKLRVFIFPPKLQTVLLDGLEDYNNTELYANSNTGSHQKRLKIEFVPTNPTHTISIIQLHKGVDVVVHNKQTIITDPVNNKALFVIGRLEKTSSTNNTTNGSHPPINIKNVTNNAGDDDASSSSISRAYWKLQEAWERYKYESPNLNSDRLTGLNADGTKKLGKVWALDCGSAPGGWTKFLFRPGITDRVYSIDPGKLSTDVLPGLDIKNNNNQQNSYGTSDSNKKNTIVRYMATTIQKAIPQLQIECKNNSRYLDIWVSDMCCKDLSSQIDYFLDARTAGIVGPGTFFVLTLKCIVGYSTTAFNEQSKEQVQRLTEPIETEGSITCRHPIAHSVHNIHLFSNRNSERTIIGYLN